MTRIICTLHAFLSLLVHGMWVGIICSGELGAWVMCPYPTGNMGAHNSGPVDCIWHPAGMKIEEKHCIDNGKK